MSTYYSLRKVVRVTRQEMFTKFWLDNLKKRDDFRQFYLYFD